VKGQFTLFNCRHLT